MLLKEVDPDISTFCSSDPWRYTISIFAGEGVLDHNTRANFKAVELLILVTSI